jgi:NADPH2:quinone reductase
MQAIRVHQHGGADALRDEEVPVPEPGPGAARVKIEAIGVNYIDTYHRTGLYPLPLPFTVGTEAAGVVDAVGPNVREVEPGMRVAYALEQGAYAEYAVVPAWKLVPLPQGVDSRSAAAVMVQGMTAHYLAHDTYPLKRGDVALVHAAAGGVGHLLVQIGKRLGAVIFGTVSTEEKARQIRYVGADEAILYGKTDFLAEVKRLTQGAGARVVYDSVGQSTFEKSLDCLQPRGYLVLFGQSSGPVPPFNLANLATKGSLFITRPTLIHYMRTREELLSRANAVFRWLVSGELKLTVGKTFPLSQAAEAHRQLEGRQTMGKVLLIPG